ncbi:hypothetical protein [Bacillus paranthracis]|uniref:hypothetical protein n=1 Tax=Bacillus cereus group TaxID=86661 RepID=UPI00061C1930|nr:hypothetical protein MON10_17380 [Bacillus paranthracis]CKG03331.1 Uncharacterised protein [Streptococcus pneumoniae]CKG14455.1 Uncharacterised protein [Streptococcus pneumoniae]
MRKHTKFGNVLLWIGPILVFVGLCMTNVISDIPFFFGKHKTIGIVLICIGVVCFIAANHLKKEKNMRDKSN